MSGDFNPEQKRYLEGFVTGLQIARSTRGQGTAPAGATEPTGPDAEHWRATFFAASQAHSIVGGSAWETTRWRAVQRAAWQALQASP